MRGPLESAANEIAEAIEDEYGTRPPRHVLEVAYGVRVGGAIDDILSWNTPGFDEVEAAGLDGTGRDGDPRFPYTRRSILATPVERDHLDRKHDRYAETSCPMCTFNAAEDLRMSRLMRELHPDLATRWPDLLECSCGHPVHGRSCSGTWATMSDGDSVLMGIARGVDPGEPCVCTIQTVIAHVLG